MKPITLLALSSLISYSVFSQMSITIPARTRGTITSLNPVWLQEKPAYIKKNLVHQDSVYYFKSKENGQDSALIMIQYFDSAGNLIERDEFNVKEKGELVLVTRLSYIDDELIKKEVTAKTINLVNKTIQYQKNLHLYEYDSAGNNTSEKLYEYFGNSLDKYQITVFDNLYDSANHIIESYHKDGNSDRFLQRTYKYDNGRLDEINQLEPNHEVKLVNLYRYDIKKNIERIYQTDISPDNLVLEFYFDDKKRIIREREYSEELTTIGLFHGNAVTQSYFYGADDLIEKQTVKFEVDGKNYYYKHYYSKE
jgi:hypothetical protein